MKPVESVIILPSQLRFVNPAIAFIRATAASCGFSESGLNEIEVAAEEALTNVIKHAFEGRSEETFKISIRFTESDFMITLFEKGMPFSPDRVAGYDPEQFENTLDTDGLGVFLMKKMMDDVIFENLGRDGKSLTLVKHIKGGHIQGIMDHSGNEVLVNSRPDVTRENLSYEIRPFRPEDALEISRCAYKAYGYTYEPYIYYPDQIVEMNRTGKLVSFIAADKHSGNIMGHIALKYKKTEDRVAEVGVGFIKPEYRLSGAFNALTNFCHEKAKERILFGTIGRAVTSHIGSQKVADSMGYAVCGIFLSLFPDDIDFKALTGKVRQKEAGLLLYRRICEDGERKIFVPLSHQRTISDLFGSLNIAVQCASVETEPTAIQSRITVDVVPVLNVADVDVHTIGVDIGNELKSTVHTLCLKHVDAIFIHFDMEDPATPFAARQCEPLGFFFCGVQPFGLNNKHELILQYMNNLDINYDMIKPYSQSAMNLLNYVRASDVNKH
ncbi:MAG: ATP-binding protein [Proteobacteria bacterium]|nr:ATP-binding protein [Pseudomonadota bacterium]